MFIFIDLSGDFNFNPVDSRYLIVGMLVVQTDRERRQVDRAVERALRQRKKKMRAKGRSELKGATSSMRIKQQFWKQVRNVRCQFYVLMVEKAAIPAGLQNDPDALYEEVVLAALKLVPVEQASMRVIVTMDHDKPVAIHQALNQTIARELQGRVPPNTPVEVYDRRSHESKGLQAVDTLTWGVFRKYERGDTEWYDVFRLVISAEVTYRKA